MVEITVTKTTVRLLPGQARHCDRYSLYECTGPDGRQFDNRSLKTLREVLRRRYGSVKLTVTED